jgi:hypothetical protein
MKQMSRLDSSNEYDPHRSTSIMLTELRTLLRRARTATARADDSGRAVSTLSGFQGHGGHDLEEIKSALAQVIETLSPWERRPS